MDGEAWAWIYTLQYAIDGIARKVKRARTSIYRRWRSKRHLIAYAVVSEMGHNPAADTGVLRGDLEAAVGHAPITRRTTRDVVDYVLVAMRSDGRARVGSD